VTLLPQSTVEEHARTLRLTLVPSRYHEAIDALAALLAHSVAQGERIAELEAAREHLANGFLTWLEIQGYNAPDAE